MSDITITLNGSEVTAPEGKTILEVAQENGIDIPTFCYVEGLSPTGACRICVVEVEGSRTLVASCHTPVAQGMVIQTHSPKVLETRRVIMDLLLSSHCGTCYMCEKANTCKLRAIAADLDVGLSRFQSKKRFYPIEDVSPYIVRDLTKCILCRKCVRACNEIAKKNVFATGYRGFDSKIVVDYDEALNKEVCRDCGICIPHCPTGALSAPVEITEEKKGTPLIIRGYLLSNYPGEKMSPISKGITNNGKDPEKLLLLLKEAQDKAGYLSEETMSELAESLGMSRSDIYGVATFYSFLSTKPLGRNVIRICQSLPCHLKDYQTIVESVAKEIGIKPGQTTADNRFSFVLTNCIGACDKAPAMLINNDVHGNLTPGKISQILKTYK